MAQNILHFMVVKYGRNMEEDQTWQYCCSSPIQLNLKYVASLTIIKWTVLKIICPWTYVKKCCLLNRSKTSVWQATCCHNSFSSHLFSIEKLRLQFLSREDKKKIITMVDLIAHSNPFINNWDRLFSAIMVCGW